MSFWSFLKVSYVRGILPNFSSIKHILIYLLIWSVSSVLWGIAMNNFFFTAIGMSGFCVMIIGYAQGEQRPSYYCLYPLSSGRKVLYEYLGNFIVYVACWIFLSLFLCLYFGFLCVIAYIVSREQVGFELLMQWILPLWEADIFDWLMAIAMLISNYCGIQLCLAMKTRFSKALCMAAVCAIGSIIVIVAMVLATQFAGIYIVFLNLRFIPFGWLFPVVLFAVSAVIFTASVILKTSAVRK